MSRGQITEQIIKKMNDFFGYECSKVHLRLLPYIQYSSINGGKVDRLKYSPEEAEIMRQWSLEHLMYKSGADIFLTKRFHDFISEILWESYVENKCTDDGQAIYKTEEE